MVTAAPPATARSRTASSDGYRKGLEDIEDRKSPDATRHKWYRSGDHDYDKAYGSKDAYKIEYRRGFEEGYDRAYREARRYYVEPQEPLHPRHERRRLDGRGVCDGGRLIWSSPARRTIAAMPIFSIASGCAVARRRNRSAPISTTTTSPSGEHRRRARLAGQQRHLAEIAAALDPRDLLARGLQHDADRRPTSTTNIDCPSSPCRTIVSPLP